MTNRFAPPRRAAGVATGALSGVYPHVSIGAPPLAGGSMRDEFLRPPTAGYVGDLLWQVQNIGTPAGATQIVPTADTEIGITRLSTNAVPAQYEGGCIAWPYTSVFGVLQPGSLQYVKVYVDKFMTDTEVFSGFLSNPVIMPRAANVVDAVGFRGDSGGANWYGITRAAAVETTIDMGVMTTGWHILGWRRWYDGSVTFYNIDASDGRRAPVWTMMGASTTNLPTLAMAPVPLAVLATVAAGPKSADIDFYGWGGYAGR